MRIYVGNLNYDTSEDTLRDAFAQYGDVDEVAIITDRETGRARGFGFVTMGSDDDANNAIEAMDGADLDGRQLNVNEARPRPNNRGNGGGRRESW